MKKKNENDNQKSRLLYIYIYSVFVCSYTRRPADVTHPVHYLSSRSTLRIDVVSSRAVVILVLSALNLYVMLISYSSALLDLLQLIRERPPPPSPLPLQ